MQQQYFSTTSTNFIGGVPFDIATFPVNNPAAIALGAKPLDAEESLNYSLGAVARLGGLTITVDAYRIDIDNRIVLSENLTSTDVVNYLTSLGFIGIGGGRFFINGVDTTTEGVDVVMSLSVVDAIGGPFRLHRDRELQFHRCHQGADDSAAVGLAHAADPVRPLQRVEL